MSTACLLIGIALLLVVFVDALWTTLWVDHGAGPLSARTSTYLWRGTLRIVGPGHHKGLSLFGPFILFFSLVLWIALLWTGWIFIFSVDPESLIHSTDKTHAGWVGRFYFVGYMMFTAGNGDYKPIGDAWQIAAALTNATGMVLVTLAITYLISIVSAVVAKRSFASQVMGLGQTAEDIVAVGWNGRDFHSLDLPLSHLGSSLAALSEQYQAYPILQYYHAASRSKSPIAALATLDEALTILRYGTPEHLRPNPAVLHSATASVEAFLDTMPGAFIKQAPQPPRLPDLYGLSEQGVPTVDAARFAAAVDGLSERRKKLLGLLRNDGWTWTEAE